MKPQTEAMNNLPILMMTYDIGGVTTLIPKDEQAQMLESNGDEGYGRANHSKTKKW